MIRRLTCFAVLLGLTLSLAGCRDTTWRRPTEEIPISPAENLDLYPAKEFNRAEDNAWVWANALDKQQSGAWAWNALGSRQLLLLLQVGANANTYRVMTRLTGTDLLDTANTNGILRAWLGQRKPANLNLATSLWTVRPKMLHGDFSNRAAAEFGVDAIKLGGAGITARQGLDDWAKRASKGAFPKVDENLQYNFELIGLSLMEVTGTAGQWRKAKVGETTVHAADLAGSSLALAVIETPKESPTGTDWRMWRRAVAEGQPSDKGFGLETESRLDLTEAFAELAAQSLRELPNNFRNISLDLDEEAKIDRLPVRFRARIPGPAIPNGAWWVIYDPRFDMIIALGRQG
jgi:hypothetical protein